MDTDVKVEEPKTDRKMSMRSSSETVKHALPTLAKLPELERTGSPVSHSRWAAMPSDNGGIGGETPLLHDGPICQDTTIVRLKPDIQRQMSKGRKH